MCQKAGLSPNPTSTTYYLHVNVMDRIYEAWFFHMLHEIIACSTNIIVRKLKSQGVSLNIQHLRKKNSKMMKGS